MALESTESEKRYYSISEIAQRFDVNPSLIRFWEKEFDLLSPKKNARGKRLYSAKDLEIFRLIHHLVKERGFTLKGAQAKLKENRSELAEKSQIIERLRQIKQALKEMRDGLGD